MYYLYCENDDDMILLRSTKIESLVEVIRSKQLKSWSISDEPINYEEEYYTSLEFMTGKGIGGAKGKNLTVRTENES